MAASHRQRDTSTPPSDSPDGVKDLSLARQPSLVVKSYSNISASDQARQHNGDVINNDNRTYNYPALQRPTEPLTDSTRELWLKAAAEGQTRRITHLARAYHVVDHADKDGLTALHHACLSGFEDIVEAILTAGANVNAFSAIFGTPLCLAVLKQRHNVVELLLNERADVSTPGGHLGSPLHAACYASDLLIVRSLVEKGAQVDPEREIQWDDIKALYHPESTYRSRFCTECRPLMIAANRGHISVIDYLADKGADMNVIYRSWSLIDGVMPSFKRPYRATALFDSSLNGHVKAIERLLHWGAKKDINDNYGRTVVHHAAGRKYPECLRVLLQAGAPLDVRDNNGRTAMHFAVVQQSLDCINILTKAGAALNLRELNGYSPMLTAANLGYVECVRMLAARHALVDWPDHTGKTALMWAASAGHLECVRTLIDCGADLDKTDDDGADAVMHAAKGSLHTTDLWSQMARMDTVAQEDTTECLRLLLGKGAPVNRKSKSENRTAFYLAAASGNVKAMEMLLDAHADIEARTVRGTTALITAAAVGRLAAVRLLISRGANISASNPEGNNALY